MPNALIEIRPGAKSIALNDLPDSAWKFLTGQPESGDSVTDALKVPWVYRSLNVRAQGISKCPMAVLPMGTDSKELWTTDDDMEPPRAQSWLKQLPKLLDRTERSLCLWGASYWLREQNEFGGNIGYRWLQTQSITPKYSHSEGLVGFDRKVNGQTTTLPVERVVYFWRPNLIAELGPGISEVQAALLAAGLLNKIDLWGNAFFDRGATPVTLLSVEGDPDSSELRRLETWWRRMVSGVRRAFETVAVKAIVKPQVIGSPPKDLAMETLTASKREDISTIMGIPNSVLFSNAANFATAQQDEWNLWTLGLVPEAEFLEDTVNEQILNPIGLRLEFKFKQLEVFQHREMTKAFETLSLVEGGVLTPNELREQLDYKPLPDGDKLREPVVAERPAKPMAITQRPQV